MNQHTIFDILKFMLGSEAWGNKTKEIILRLRNVTNTFNFFCFIPLSQPKKNLLVDTLYTQSPNSVCVLTALRVSIRKLHVYLFTVFIFLHICSFGTQFNCLSHRKTDKKFGTSLTLVLQIGEAWTETG